MSEIKNITEESKEAIGKASIFRAPPSFSDLDESDTPLILRAQLKDLSDWAIANQNDAKKDTIQFWLLKIPAIITSASAGIFAHYELTALSVIAGAIASICIAIDGIQPRGMLKSIHTRAFHDISILVNSMKMQWRTRDMSADPEEKAQEIMRASDDEWKRIAKYISDAESAINPNGNKD